MMDDVQVFRTCKTIFEVSFLDNMKVGYSDAII